MAAGGKAVVIDTGSGTIKAGFAADKAPQYVIPNVVGYPKPKELEVHGRDAGVYIDLEGDVYYSNVCGAAALSSSFSLDLAHPVEHGIIVSWEDMCKVWQHTFTNELQVASTDQPVLMTEAPLNTKESREEMAEYLFEAIVVPGMLVAGQAELSLYASGRTTGVVLDCGDGVTDIVPIIDGNPLAQAIVRMDLAGRDLTNYMLKLLSENGKALTTYDADEVAQDIKEKLAYVALDYEQEKQKDSSNINTPYTLPDGSVITVGSERFRCPEALFSPSLLGMDSLGIHERTNSSIQMCDVDVRKVLYSNIVLCGGSTVLTGIAERMNKEMAALGPNTIKVVAEPERKYGAWLGGSILASLSTFNQRIVTKADYGEHGASVIHRKLDLKA